MITVSLIAPFRPRESTARTSKTTSPSMDAVPRMLRVCGEGPVTDAGKRVMIPAMPGVKLPP